MRYPLLLSAFMLLQTAVYAQTKSDEKQSPRMPQLPPLPENALLSASAISVLPPANGQRYQYQLVRVYNDERIYLAPAWRGSSKLEPPRKNLFSNADPGEVDALLLMALNGLTEEGWEMVEIQSMMQPISASQKLETGLPYNDPNRPTYTATTTIATRTQTRYLLRKAR